MGEKRSKSDKLSIVRPASAGSSRLARRVEEKLSLYRNDPEALEDLQNRVANSKRPATANPAGTNYLRLNVACVSLPVSQLDPDSPLLGRQTPDGRRPSSASCPGSGGSPTAREDYIKHRVRRRSEVSTRHEEVQERRQIQLRSWYDKKVASANRGLHIRGRKTQEKQLQLETEETAKRNACWHVLVALCYRLEAMRELLIENQQRRAIFLREKEAAIKIAKWFKSKLVERRHLYLIESCRRFKKFSTEAIQQYKKRVRRKCAWRIFDFMQRAVNTTRMMSAVQQLLRYSIVIQRCWRNLVASRQAQMELLELQLAKFEHHLLAYNRKKASGNNASVFIATARKIRPLHEDLRLTLIRTSGATARGKITGVASSTLTRQRKVKMDDEEDDITPEQLLFLSTLTVKLPKPIKDQVVQERMAEEIKRFYHRWDRYAAEKKVYMNQKPIDDARLNLLRSAGIDAKPQVVEPVRPKLRFFQTIEGLSAMMENGLRMLVNSSSELSNANIDSKTITRNTQRRRSQHD